MKRRQRATRQTARKSSGGTIRLTSVLTHFETDAQEEEQLYNRDDLMSDDESPPPAVNELHNSGNDPECDREDDLQTNNFGGDFQINNSGVDSQMNNPEDDSQISNSGIDPENDQRVNSQEIEILENQDQQGQEIEILENQNQNPQEIEILENQDQNPQEIRNPNNQDQNPQEIRNPNNQDQNPKEIRNPNNQDQNPREIEILENQSSQEEQIVTQRTSVSSLSDFMVSIDTAEYYTPPQSQVVGANNQINNHEANQMSELDTIRESESVEQTDWISNDTVHVFKFGFKIKKKETCKIAAFDLDGTLITPKSKKKFSTDINDWKMLDGRLKSKIKGLVQQGFEFVIFSNQMGVSMKFVKLNEIKLKFQNIVTSIGIPCVALFCTHLDKYRKPAIGMFEFYKTINPTPIDLNESFFVGDAMGRPKDHSAADLLFAFNCRLAFIPIESFLSGFEKPKKYAADDLKRLRVPRFSPIAEQNQLSRIYAKSSQNSNDGQFCFVSELVDAIEKFVDNNCKSIVILLVGLFGSGKTFFFDKNLAPHHYECIGYDPSRSWEDELKKFNTFVQNDEVLNKRIVIDQPNLTEADRKRWISLAKHEGYEVFAIHLKVPVEQCAHLIRFRSFYVQPDRRAPTQTELLKQSLLLREPRYDEGFKTIYLMDFFENFDASISQYRQYYHHYLYDKP